MVSTMCEPSATLLFGYAGVIDIADAFLALLKFLLMIITLASISLFYTRWHFLRKNVYLYVGLYMLAISFALDFVKCSGIMQPDITILLHDFFEALFIVVFAYSYFRMLKMTELR
ncbi:MAG: hypothetical protein QXP42_01050 [Candidatus Micrarchaeia archaeon]